MPELPRITIRYNGLFDFDTLYATVIDWAKNYGYMWHEVDYKHKVPSPSGAEQEFKWLIEKSVTSYIKHSITFMVHAWDMTDVEVTVEGKKKSLTNARMYIWIEGKLITDWQGIFKKGGRFGAALGKLYDRLIEKEIDSVYTDTLYYRQWDLHALLKKYFDMQTKKYAYKGYLKEN